MRGAIKIRVSFVLLMVFLAICVFHMWSDARNIERMRELKRQGLSDEEIHQKVRFLCVPLNISAGVVLFGIVIARIIEWRRSKAQR